MALDTDSATLLTPATIGAGTITAAFTADNMKGYCVQATASDGVFTAGSYAWLQGSIDGSTYTHIVGSTTTVTGTGTSYLWNVDAPYYNSVQVGVTIPSGNIVWGVKIRTIGER